jgi:hypothetical protein
MRDWLSCKKSQQRACFLQTLCLSCEDVVKRWPSISQLEASHQNLTCWILISDFELTELQESNFCWLCQPSIIICSSVLGQTK